VGQDRHRRRLAVEGTVPYGLLALCLLVVWFAAYGQPADVAVDRARVP
jgi:hypothetical protein